MNNNFYNFLKFNPLKVYKLEEIIIQSTLRSFLEEYTLVTIVF